jgi:acyl carrier protein
MFEKARWGTRKDIHMNINKLCDLIKDYCKKSNRNIGNKAIIPNTQFPDLDFDITDMSDLLVFIKDKTGISIPDHLAGDFLTLNDLYNFIEGQ